MNVTELLADAVDKKASDIFVSVNSPLVYKIDGKFVATEGKKLFAKETAEFVTGLYKLAENRNINNVSEITDDDFSLSIPQVSRFRVSIYKQRGSFGAVVRIVRFGLPNPREIGISSDIITLSDKKRGMILVTGTAGSGKSTTLACIIDHINRTRSGHIITLEDPVEFLHRNQKSIVTQREISYDTESYLTGLRASFRQTPDVVLLGEMRDHETISVAMTAAETGHLVFSTLHTMGAANTVDRIVDSFPPNQQNQVRIQLSMVLQAVISQQLLPTKEGGLMPAFEIMITDNAIRNMIRESKSHQIDQSIHTSSSLGMISMDTYILNLYKKGTISAETAVTYSMNPEVTEKRIDNLRTPIQK